MSRLGKKWLAVAVIWGVVSILSGWNTYLVNHVQTRRQALGILQMDQRFLQANHSGILELRRQRARLTHAAQSVGLGLLVIENDLRQLSLDFGLEQMQMEADDNSQEPGPVPVSMLAIGPIPGLVEWLAAVEDDHPYLVIERMDLSYDHAKRIAQLKVFFNYHVSLAGAQRTG